MITDDAGRKIARFNEVGLHYNLVADQIYVKRFTQGTDPFSLEYLRYVIAGLIVFEIERMMGPGSKYDFNIGFAYRLNTKLQRIRHMLEPLMNFNLTEINLQQHSRSITEIYNTLSLNGNGGLNENQNNHFHVGATKILHFLNPRIFIIVDSNASRAFRMSHAVPFRNTAQPGYSDRLYVQCMECARKDIIEYGVERFKALEPDTPITRIYDKLTFATGAGL